MNLLIFEFATATGLQNQAITLEGEAMLKGLLKDLKDVDNDYLVSKNSTFDYNELNEKGKTLDNKCRAINVDDNFFWWLDKNIKNYDACLLLAPEEDLILYKLTQKLEKNKIKIIGSTSEAVLTCSDKFQTYQHLKDKFPVVKSEKVYFTDLKNYKQIMGKKSKMIVKPADGVSCSGVKVVQSYSDFIKASAQLKRVTNFPYFLLQDFAEGTSASVSLLSNGSNAVPLSLNRQNIELKSSELKYNGGKIPFKNVMSDKSKEIAKTVIESIDGLKGYVGVDLIIDDVNEDVSILEINPRLTTSYVALRKLLNFNLGEAIIEAVQGKLPNEITLNGSLTFFKEGNQLIFKEND